MSNIEAWSIVPSSSTFLCERKDNIEPLSSSLSPSQDWSSCSRSMFELAGTTASSTELSTNSALLLDLGSPGLVTILAPVLRHSRRLGGEVEFTCGECLIGSEIQFHRMARAFKIYLAVALVLRQPHRRPRPQFKPRRNERLSAPSYARVAGSEDC